MKKIFLLLVLSFVLFSCSNGFVINGTVKDVADGTKVKLERQQESLGFVVTIDTAVVKDGQFTFKGKSVEPALYQITIDSVRGKSPIIVENGEMTIAIDKENLLLNKIAGTYNNEQLSEYSRQMDKIQFKVKEFQKANDATMQSAKKTRDTAAIRKLFVENNKVKEQVRDQMLAFQKTYTDAHPKSYVSLILLQGAVTFPDADVKALKTRFDNLDSSLKTTTVGKNLEKKFAEMKTVNVGRRAPNFTAPDVNGKQVALNESIGRVTIIDFWASWCPPCRKENPNMVALYNEFHEKGLNIIGVSLDKDGAKWKEAIAKDGLVWPQVSNLKYWSDPIAELYGVQALPATYVLNHYGVVVAKDLSGDALRQKVVSLLQKKNPMTMRNSMKMPVPPQTK
jgi:peroxiredoxin